MCNFDASRYERFFERPWLSDEARRFLFDERRLDPRVVRWCRLTSWRDRQGAPWLQTPYYDREGRLVGLQNRRLTPLQLPRGGEKEASLTPLVSPEGDQKASLTPLTSPEGDQKASPRGGLEGVEGLEGVPRFRFPQGSQCGIYNQPVLNRLKPGDELYITEGCSDCWAMLSSGHKAIAIPSATLLSRKDVELLTALHAERSTKFKMYPDCDAPGERLFLQLQQVLPHLEHLHLPSGCKDFSDYYLHGLVGLTPAFTPTNPSV